MTTDETARPEKLVSPRSAAGATLVAIPLAAVLGGVGWIGQKVLALDEEFRQAQTRIVAQNEQIEKLVAAGVRIEQGLVADSTNTQRNEKQVTLIEARQLDLAQRISSAEARIEMLREEHLIRRGVVVRGAKE